ncbi:MULTISPECIES: helix-turn-helix domain-containing protein [Sphingobacterium]|uniref:helix-turn-helix domain-containing protein n=1 Tax=Sphingobacterium TaxID=28453 RepID=UPI00257D0155|nr:MULTISPECIES: AraC family transcriptional regulator [Sphingobacterium]
MDKGPYFLIYDQEPECIEDVKGNLPFNCSYPLVNADSAVLRTFKCGTELLIQRLESPPFVVDLVELNSKKPFSFKLRLKKSRLFLYFMIDGVIDFFYENRQRISHIRTKRFYVAYGNRENYKVKPSVNKNIALIVTMKRSWMKKVCHNFFHLNAMLQRFDACERSYETLPQCHIDGIIGACLKEMYTYNNENSGALNGTLRKAISLILERYNKLVTEKLASIAYRARDFIDVNFSNSKLNIEDMASDLATTTKTLTKHFKYEFGITPYAYLIEVRLWNAKKLIESRNLKAKDVYWQVGYDDVKSFRVQYRKAYGDR